MKEFKPTGIPTDEFLDMLKKVKSDIEESEAGKIIQEMMKEKLIDGDIYKGKPVTKITEKGLKEWNRISPTRKMSVEEVMDILGLTVKHDNANKSITFLSMVSTYTEDNQMNISFRAPSATGKSYIPLELSDLFPKEDVIKIAYSSPTSFYHDSGEWDDNLKCVRINLERKILIFLDQPHDELLKRLRPMLSHDQKELWYKITDKRERKGLRTKNVVIIGFPSVYFCTGSLRTDEQETTRGVILSPETSQEKLRESIMLRGLKEGNIGEFNKLKSDARSDMLRERISLIKAANIRHIIIEDHEEIVNRFMKNHPKLKPRHSRDVGRLFSIIKSLALLNLWNREIDSNNDLKANREDVETAFKIWGQISLSQELGIAPYIYRLFKEIIEPAYLDLNKGNTKIGLSRMDIIKKHFEVYGRPIQDWFLRQQILPELESAGLIYQEPDASDKRKMLVLVTPQSDSLYLEESDEKIYSEYNSGVTQVDTPPSNSLYSTNKKEELEPNRKHLPDSDIFKEKLKIATGFLIKYSRKFAERDFIHNCGLGKDGKNILNALKQTIGWDKDSRSRIRFTGKPTSDARLETEEEIKNWKRM